MWYTDNPERDFDRYERALAKERERLPFCDECDEPIEDEFLNEFDGTLICDSCMERNHRRQTSDFMME